MKLFDQIQEDIKKAMKAKDLQTLDTLRLVASSLKNKAIDLREELKDEEVIAVIRSDVKKLNDAIADFAKGAREDLVEKTKVEIEILKKYLPAELSEEELEKRVTKILGEQLTDDVKDLGRAMGVVMKDLAGMVDGNRVRAMVQKVLGDKKD